MPHADQLTPRAPGDLQGCFPVQTHNLCFRVISSTRSNRVQDRARQQIDNLGTQKPRRRVLSGAHPWSPYAIHLRAPYGWNHSCYCNGLWDVEAVNVRPNFELVRSLRSAAKHFRPTAGPEDGGRDSLLTLQVAVMTRELAEKR